MTNNKKLNWYEKFTFGAGDFGFNLYWTSISAFLMIFYTDVFGISAAAAGTMLLTTKIIDAITDPIMGIIADRTKTKWGRYRPWFLWIAIPMAASGVITFSVPDISEGGKLIYAYATFAIMMVIYTMINIPYNALSGVMTNEPQERTQLNSFRFVGGFLGGTFVTYCTPKLVKFLGNGNEVLGWQLTMVVYGIIASILFFNIFKNTKERIVPVSTEVNNPLTDLSDLLKNRPWIILFVFALTLMITITLRMGSSAYYMKYYIGMPDLNASFLTIYGIALALGALATPFMTKFIDKKLLMISLMFLVGLFSMSFFFIPKTNITLIFIMQFLTGFCLGPKSPLAFSMYADCADYTEYKTGRRATGLTFAAATFSQKLGGALASFIIGGILSSMGYVANAAQTASSEHGILILVSIIPGIVAILSGCVMIFYNLDKNLILKINQELENRKK